MRPVYLTRTMQYPIFRLNRKERIKLSKLSKCRAYKGLIVFSLNLQVLFQPPGNRAHLVSFYKSQRTIFSRQTEEHNEVDCTAMRELRNATKSVHFGSLSSALQHCAYRSYLDSCYSNR